MKSTYKGLPIHPPGRVLTDLAVTLADGGDCLADLAALRDQAALFGQVASHPTAYRVLDRVRTSQLEALRTARAAARARVWAAGGGPHLTDEQGDQRGLVLDVDASLLTAHSEKQGAAPTYEHGFGFHPLLVFLDRPDVSGGEALAAILRPGNAGSNTAADHLSVLDLALAQLSEHARPTPDAEGSPEVLIRSDSAGATHAFLTGCRERGVRDSVGLPVDHHLQDTIGLVPDDVWVAAIRADGEERGNGELVELTALLDLSPWPAGSRVICRRERPHPGAQYAFTDIDGHRFQVFLTDTQHCGNDVPHLELRPPVSRETPDATPARFTSSPVEAISLSTSLPAMPTMRTAAWTTCAPIPTTRSTVTQSMAAILIEDLLFRNNVATVFECRPTRQAFRPRGDHRRAARVPTASLTPVRWPDWRPSTASCPSSPRPWHR